MVGLNPLQKSLSLWLCAWLILPSFLDASDGFLRAYKQGLKAIDNEQWDRAAEKMRQAAAGRSEENGRLKKGGYFRKYLPHYFLGVALFKLGDCASALESLAESENQGVITRRKKDYEDLLSLRQQCETRLRSAKDVITPEPAPETPPTKKPSPNPQVQQRNLQTERQRQPKPPTPKFGAPPAELDLAVEAFLVGEYSRVLTALENFSAKEGRAIAHAHLLRSAALFALHRIQNDAELLTRARHEARAAFDAEPELTLPKRFFSPRFRKLAHTMNAPDLED